MFPRFTTHVQTCLTTNQVFAGCEKLLQKVKSSSTLRNEIFTCYAFYRPRATNATNNGIINFLLQDRFDVSGKTRNIAIQLVLQQCCKTSFTFFVARFSVLLRETCFAASDVTHLYGVTLV